MNEESKRKLENQMFELISNANKVDGALVLRKLDYIIRLGADVNAKRKGKSILSVAKELNARDDIIKRLEKDGAEEYVVSKEEAEKLGKKFVVEFCDGEVKKAVEYADMGANLDTIDDNGSTALTYMVYFDNDVAVNLLLELGADVDARNAKGDTPLMIASSQDALDSMKILLDNGANTELLSKDGCKAILGASDKGAKLIVDARKERLKKNADKLKNISKSR